MSTNTSFKQKAFAILLFCVPIVAFAQPLPRTYYGVRLEPRSGILVGAGQTYVRCFNEFADATNGVPAFFMTYSPLNLSEDTFALHLQYLQNQLDSLPTSAAVQFGLSFSGTNTDKDVAAGKYDANLAYLKTFIQQSGRRWYLRPGYEFNLYLLKYQPAYFKNAFRRIANQFAGCAEVTMVWNTAGGNGNTTWANAKIWYPGDDVVDWWGWNFFKGQLEGIRDYAVIKEFCDSADAHGKPVMLAEVAPRATDQQVVQGLKSWERFFAPLFNVIETLPQIKAFGYINWNWPDYAYMEPVFSGWGDSRLQSNQLVADSFNNKIKNRTYIFKRKIPTDCDEEGCACECIIYTFTGNGNWADENNWSDNKIPPGILLAGSVIVINPADDGECILNKLQIVAFGGKIKVMAGKKFTILGDLLQRSFD